eukprot:gene14236-30290_t
MHFDEGIFRNKVSDAIAHVRRVLNGNKRPMYASDIRHAYDDKFSLSDFLTNTMIASNLNCLKSIGLSEEGLRKTVEWRSQNRSVSLRFNAEEKCTFVRMEEREVDSNSKLVTEKVGAMSLPGFTTTKVVTKVKEYYWKFEVMYELLVFYGTEEKNPDRVVLATKTASHE